MGISVGDNGPVGIGKGWALVEAYVSCIVGSFLDCEAAFLIDGVGGLGFGSGCEFPRLGL